jgi:hypothetical protein
MLFEYGVKLMRMRTCTSCLRHRPARGVGTVGEVNIHKLDLSSIVFSLTVDLGCHMNMRMI